MASIENRNSVSPHELLEQIGIKPILARIAGKAVSMMDRLGIEKGPETQLASDLLFEIIPRHNRMATCMVRFKSNYPHHFDPGSLSQVLDNYFAQSNGHMPHSLNNPRIETLTPQQGSSEGDILIFASTISGIVSPEDIDRYNKPSFFIYNTPQGFNVTFDHAEADALQIFPLLQRILTQTEFDQSIRDQPHQGRVPVSKTINTTTTHARDLLKAAAWAGMEQKGKDSLLYITHLAKEKRIIPYPVPSELIIDEQRRRSELPKMLDQELPMSESPIAKVVDMVRLKRLSPKLGSILYKIASSLTPIQCLPSIAALTGIGPVQRYERSPQDINETIGDAIEEIAIDLHMYPQSWNIPLLFRVAIDLPGSQGIVPVRTVSLSGLPHEKLQKFALLMEKFL